MGNYSVYISGPSYHPEEKVSMQFLSNYLKKNGFNVFSNTENGFQDELIDIYLTKSNKNSLNDVFFNFWNKAAIFAFAFEYYHIIKSDICIGFINGRVPDESTVIKMGIAFGTGIPVINYKLDSRILFPNGDNTMIQGLTGNFKNVSKLEKLPKTILKKIKKFTKKSRESPENIKSNRKEQLPPYNKLLFNVGKKIEDYLKNHEKYGNKKYSEENLEKMVEFIQSSDILNELYTYDNKSNNDLGTIQDNSKDNKKVYCSGALFCPAEVREMAKIASTLEQNGFKTYLPQRDGGEPFVIGSAGNPLAGSPILIPLINLLNKILYAIDIYEINHCDFFAINLNGRAPDDGAMAELGVAFAAGKPIVLFKNDKRTLFNDQMHPTFQAFNYFLGNHLIDQYKNIPSRLTSINQYLSNLGENKYQNSIPSLVNKFVQFGHKWENRLKRLKAPENPMLIWDQN